MHLLGAETIYEATWLRKKTDVSVARWNAAPKVGCSSG
jgi:hypothetical protein